MPQGRRRHYVAPLLAALVLGALVSSALGSGTASHDEQPSRDGVTQAGSLKKGKLDSRLAQVSAVEATNGNRSAAGRARTIGLEAVGDRVRIVVESTDPAAAETVVRAGGGTVEATYGNLVRGLVQPSALMRLTQTAGVRYVRPPFRPDAQAVTDEGVVSTNASTWQGLGRTGAGVKVAIVDLGFSDYAARQASGDLPGSLTTVDFCSGQLPTATAHGTAVAEVVHAMAPAAQLYLICVEDEVSLGQAEEYAKANGITIVNHSVAWFNSESRRRQRRPGDTRRDRRGRTRERDPVGQRGG